MSLRLENLTRPNDPIRSRGSNPEIQGLALDSRKVEKGFLFIAIPGTKADGRAFLQDALDKGASAVMVPEGTDTSSLPPTIGVLETPHMREATALIASRFYPRQPDYIAAVTGTSGKTSTAEFTRKLWDLAGHRAASLGTLGVVSKEDTHYGSLTTPDAVTMHQTLHHLAEQGVTRLCLEASSHGLILSRLEQVKIKAAAFTNLSRDHLDYHTTMEEYFAAKMRLFSDLLAKDGVAVLNADVPEFEVLDKISRTAGRKVLSYGVKGKDLRLVNAEPDTKGQRLTLEVFGKTYDIVFPIIGSFQGWNALAALGNVLASGEDPSRIVPLLEKLTGVPGRLELVGKTPQGATVFVDYAHKPAALEQVLIAMRPHVTITEGAKLHVIFGCGGNRDKGKRPLMGEIAQRLADKVIVTDDNPRGENPLEIRQEILNGCVKSPNLREIGDRAEAINAGIQALQTGDVLVIAGKGHETGQIVGDTTLPFDDAEVARKALKEMKE